MSLRKIKLVDWIEANRADFGGEIKFDEPLSRHAYYRIGGAATAIVFPKSIEDLAWVARALAETSTLFFVVGLGSNLLVSDTGFAGLIVKTARLGFEISLTETGALRTGAGVAVSSLLRQAGQAGWGGLELLTGIPGSVGGAVAMNAGTHLGEAKDRLLAVEAFDLKLGESRRYEGDALRFDYRRNLFLSSTSIIYAAEWRVEHEAPAAVKARIDETLARRKSTQPIEFPSCGSVFKNPRASGLRAWEVIEKVGLRGHRIGDAQFSEKHPNFIVNLGKAQALDVRGLIELAKSQAQTQLGIVLEEEVKFVGNF